MADTHPQASPPASLKEKFSAALSAFIGLHSKNPPVVGILAAGSAVTGVPDKNSDIDVHVVLDRSSTRERGTTWLHGVEVEYFINPVKQIREYFSQEAAEGSFATARMFSSGRIVYQRKGAAGKQMALLVEEAKLIMRRKGPKPDAHDVEMMRYTLDDLRKDLEDVYLRRDAFAFSLIAGELADASVSAFTRMRRKPAEKSKRLQEHLRRLDPEFERLLSEALLEKSLDLRFQALMRLADYAERLLGGPRPKEWSLRTRCTC